MKRLRRFWRRNAGLLGVLCGAVLLVIYLLYFGSGQQMMLAPEPTLVASVLPDALEIQVGENEPMPETTPRVTPLPDDAYESMYSNVRGMDGERLFDWERIDFAVPYPGYEGEYLPNYKGYWQEYIKKEELGYIVYKGYVVCTCWEPPEMDLEELNGLHSSVSAFGYIWWWTDYVDENGETIREKLKSVEKMDFRAEPSEPFYNFRYEGDVGDKKYMTGWLDAYEHMPLLWGDWIIDTNYPPPGYDPWEDELVVEYFEYLHSEITEEGIGDWRAHNSYADQWRRFFDENPEMLHIDQPSLFAG